MGLEQEKRVMAGFVHSTYHDSRKRLGDRLARHGRRMGLTAKSAASATSLKAWQRRARAKLVELLGLGRMRPAPARAAMTESVDCGDYHRELWLMQTQRDVTMPFYLLRPRGPARRRPVVICPHGHGGGGKVGPAGVPITRDVAGAIEKYNYAYGVQFARAGFLAFCPDARGFGQRQEREVREDVLANSCHFLQMMGAPQGIPVAGMWTFDLMRLLDHIARRKDVVAGQVGCAGLSGGGLQTLYLSAVDTRVACAVVSGYFYGVRESLLEMPGNCACNMVPHLWEHFDMGDLGALIAPRPLLIETGDADNLNGASGLKNVRPQVAIARRAYRGPKVADRICHDIFPGPHRWHGAEAVPWMGKWLAG